MKTLELPYESLATIRASITKLDDLVAIFSQKDGSHFLYVYNTDVPPITSTESLEVITLQDLPDKDLSSFDGLLVSFSALDVVRDDLLTKGPSFYPIEQIFVEKGQQGALHQTMQHLAAYFVFHLPEWAEKRSSFVQQRTKAKLIQLALPTIFEKLPDTNNLMAIIPSLDLYRFVGKGEAQFVWNDPRASLNLNTFSNLDVNSDHDWVVALEELSLFNTGVNLEGAGFIELRDILRLAGLEATLPPIRYQLAHYCHDHSSENQYLFHTAIALTAEYWLADEDVEDLVVFCPHNDFEHFIRTGDALRVYRLPIEGNSPLSAHPGIFCSLSQLLRKGLPANYDQFIFSYPVAVKYLSFPDSVKFLDLGEVLQKAGHQKALARTYWLLSSDLLKSAMSTQTSGYDTVDLVIDMAIRACVLFDLINPWEWRQGRWGQFLKASYQDLLVILEEAALRSGPLLAGYYWALHCWYGCWLSVNTVSDLNSMLTSSRAFERSFRDHLRPDLAQHLTRVEHLGEIGRWILNKTQGDLYVESESDQKVQSKVLFTASTSRVFRRTARLSKPWPLLSPLFLRGLETLLKARRRREELHSHVQDADTLILELRRLSSSLKRQQRIVFAPTHEQEVLTLLYQQEIDNSDVLLREVETSTKITANIRNPWLDIHQDIQLILEIANVGKVEAKKLEIIPTSLKGLRLLEELTLREIPVLSPGASAQIQYKVRVERLDTELQLECDFRDRSDQKRSDTWTFQLNVRSLDESPFRVKANHYQFGRPIQSPGDFYGRRSEFQNILSHLIGRNKQNLLLRGPRRMGKTSLLYMLSDVLKHPATRRLFDLPPDWDSELNQLHPIFLSVHAFSSEGGEVQVSQFFHALLEGVANVLAVEPEERTDSLYTFRNREKEVGTVNSALEQVARLLGPHAGEQIIVLLDEYDEVYRPGSGALDRSLREFVSVEQRLTWIIASTLGLFEAVKSVSSPWFNIFPIIELKRLSEKAAVDLVEKPSQEEGVVWRSDAVLALLDETGCHPAFTQLFCAKVIEHLNRIHSNYVLYDTIATVADQIVSEQETGYSHFEFFWSDTPGIGQLILLILDQLEIPLKRDEIRQRVLARLTEEFGDLPHHRVKDPYGDLVEWWDKEFKRGIDWADEITDAISPDAQRRYIFSMLILRRWLRRRRQHEDLLAEALDKISKEMERDGLVNA